MPASRSASRSRWCCSALLSLPVLWWLLRLIPPQPAPHRLSADAAPVRHHARRKRRRARTPWWLTLLRLTLATLRHPRGRRAAVESAARDRGSQGAARAADRRRLRRPPATWDVRMRTAEDLIARAETDNRGVALIPCRSRPRHLASRRRAPRACGSSRSSRSRMRSSAPTCCRRSGASSPRRRTSSSSGSPTASISAAARISSTALARLVGERVRSP